VNVWCSKAHKQGQWTLFFITEDSTCYPDKLVLHTIPQIKEVTSAYQQHSTQPH